MQMIHILYGTGTCFLQNGARKSKPRRFTPAVGAAERAAKKHPELTSRVWQAAELVDTPDAMWTAPEAEQFPIAYWDRTVTARHKVKSLSDGVTIYTVSEIVWGEPELAAPVPDRRHVLSCNCPDYQHKQAPVVDGQPTCKHILAVRLRAYLVAQYGRPITAEEAVRPATAVAKKAIPLAAEVPDPEAAAILAEARKKARNRGRWQAMQESWQQIDVRRFELEHSRQP